MLDYYLKYNQLSSHATVRALVFFFMPSYSKYCLTSFSDYLWLLLTLTLTLSKGHVMLCA